MGQLGGFLLQSFLPGTQTGLVRRILESEEFDVAFDLVGPQSTGLGVTLSGFVGLEDVTLVTPSRYYRLAHRFEES